MNRHNLVTGKKQELFSQFKGLQQINRANWLKILRNHDPWYDTAKGNNAWSNAIRGLAGNEVLRRIISDMQTIVATSRIKSTIKKQGLTRQIKA